MAINRILLVDDHRDGLSAMARLLSMNGYDVRQAGSLREATDVCSAWLPGLIITDLGLPDGNGAEFVRAIRTGRSVGAIAVTGQAADHCSAEDRGLFTAFLTKPVSFDQLLEAIRMSEGAP